MAASQPNMFQSPSGDSLFSDTDPNPARFWYRKDKGFQSPSGDSLFSDHRQKLSNLQPSIEKFQSPSGDSLFSDVTSAQTFLDPQTPLEKRFNPLAGIRCFLTHRASQVLKDHRVGFNPLAGIRCFLTRCHYHAIY